MGGRAADPHQRAPVPAPGAGAAADAGVDGLRQRGVRLLSRRNHLALRGALDRRGVNDIVRPRHCY